MLGQTLFKGTVNEIGQIGGYFSLLEMAYSENRKIGINFSSQAGMDISLLLERVSSKYTLAHAYFNDDRDFTDGDIAQGVDFVYRQIKEVFRRKPVEIKGYSEPHLGKVIVPLGNMDLHGFLIEFCKRYDHDSRLEIPAVKKEDIEKS